MSRTVDLELSDYMTRVNTRMSDVAGVTYMEVYKDLHGDTAAIRVAFESSIAVEDFVNKIVAASGFASTATHSAEDAREINLRAAALVAFSRATPGWLPVRGGGVVSAPSPEDIFLVVPSRTKSGDWGFEARRLVAGAIEERDAQLIVSSEASFESVGGGIDIKDALAAYDLALTSEPQAPRA